MKIRTARDVEKLDLKIKEELGVDVKEYRNEEAVENFVELLVFPKYVFNWVIRPVIIALILFVVGFYVFDLVHVEYLIYGIVGFVLFIVLGIQTGLLFLMWRMKTDIWGVVDYSLDIMKTALEDMNQVNQRITAENRKDVLALLFKGIIHLVSLPLISKAVSRKVPFIGGIVGGVVKKILIIVSDHIKFDEEDLNKNLNLKNNKPNTVQDYTNSIHSASNGLEKVMNFTFKVAQFPLKLGAGVVLIMLILFLYLIH